MQHYLGPGRPLTALDTWEKVVAAADGGLLGENQWCELKEMPSPSNTKTNRELARDLASLSVYGGVLIYGVRDKVYEVVGCPIEGLADRISQVAAMGICPPLTPLILDPIEGPGGQNLLIVSVAPSQRAPHMVDERYYGRSSNGKRPLSDPEVRDLLLTREQRVQGFSERLESLAQHDPIDEMVEGAPTGNAHAFFRAEPCTPARFEGVDPITLKNWLLNLKTGSNRGVNLLQGCSAVGNDPDGVSLQTFFGGPKASAEHEGNLASFSVHDDFTVTAVSGGATAKSARGNDGPEITAMTTTVGLFAGQFLEAVQKLSIAYGYQGEWRVGVHMNNLRGATVPASWMGSRIQPYPQDTSTQSMIIHPKAWDDLEKAIQEATMHLLTKYLRGLGLGDWSYSDLIQ